MRRGPCSRSITSLIFWTSFGRLVSLAAVGSNYIKLSAKKPKEIENGFFCDTRNWPDLAIGLYDKLTGRDAEISYTFDNFELSIPSSTASDAEHALWKMNGTIRTSTKNNVHGGSSFVTTSPSGGSAVGEP